MAAEGARDNRGIFRIGTRPREVASVIIPSPTRPEVKPQTSPPPSRQPDKRPTLTPEEKKKGKLLGRLVLAGGLALFATGVGVLTTKLTGDNSQETETSASFDPTKDEGTMGPSNTIFVPREELKNYPDFDENGNPLIVVAVSKDKDIGYIRQKRWAYKAGEEDMRNFFIQRGIPAGTTIPAPHDGYLFFNIADFNDTGSNDSPALQGFKVFFLNPQGKLMWIDTNVYLSSDEARGSVKQFLDGPNYYYVSRSHTGGDPNWWKQGILVERGESVLSTQKKINYDYAIGAALNGVMSSENAVLGDMSPLTASSNSTTQKLVAVE